jgi:type IX secretion system PorP/SprF family membrane protein
MLRLIIILSFSSSLLVAQQSEQFSTYMVDPYTSNPAYAGLDGSLIVTAGIRQQWNDFAGQPSSQLIQAHLPWYKARGAAGIQMISEQIGNGQLLHAALSYNYVGQYGELLYSGGISGGVSSRRFNGSAWRAPEGIYEGGVINHGDPELANESTYGFSPFINIGVYAIWRSFEGGIAMRQVLSPDAKLDPLGNFGFRNWWHTQATYNYIFSPELSFRPSFQVKTDGTEWQSDISFLLSYNGKLFGGSSLRGYSRSSLNAIVIIGGVQLSPNYRLFYSYDFAIGPLSRVAGATHELTLKFDLNKRLGGNVLPAIIYNPRFL